MMKDEEGKRFQKVATFTKKVTNNQSKQKIFN